MKQLVALLMIAFLVPTTAALAKNPCKEDKAKFCKDAKAAGKKVSECLKEHSAELTPACKEWLDKPKDPAKKAEKKAKKAAEGKSGDKPADKPAEQKPAEGAAPPPADPAAPGGAETKP